MGEDRGKPIGRIKSFREGLKHKEPPKELEDMPAPKL